MKDKLNSYLKGSYGRVDKVSASQPSGHGFEPYIGSGPRFLLSHMTQILVGSRMWTREWFHKKYFTIRIKEIITFNPLLHRYSFLCLLQHTTFENIVTMKEIAPAGAFSSFATMFSKLSNLKNFISFSSVNIQDLSKSRLLQDCCMGERVKLN